MSNIKPFLVHRRVKELEAQRKMITGWAKKQFKMEDCPLRHNHYELSHLLFGLSQYAWDCGFCGKHDEV